MSLKLLCSDIGAAEAGTFPGTLCDLSPLRLHIKLEVIAKLLLLFELTAALLLQV